MVVAAGFDISCDYTANLYLRKRGNLAPDLVMADPAAAAGGAAPSEAAGFSMKSFGPLIGNLRAALEELQHVADETGSANATRSTLAKAINMAIVHTTVALVGAERQLKVGDVLFVKEPAKRVAPTIVSATPTGNKEGFKSAFQGEQTAARQIQPMVQQVSENMYDVRAYAAEVMKDRFGKGVILAKKPRKGPPPLDSPAVSEARRQTALRDLVASRRGESIRRRRLIRANRHIEGDELDMDEKIRDIDNRESELVKRLAAATKEMSAVAAASGGRVSKPVMTRITEVTAAINKLSAEKQELYKDEGVASEAAAERVAAWRQGAKVRLQPRVFPLAAESLVSSPAPAPAPAPPAPAPAPAPADDILVGVENTLSSFADAANVGGKC